MPIGSQVWGWPAAGFDQSSLKALLQLFLSDLAFSVGQAFFHFFILSDFKLLKQRSRKKKENITKLLNQSLVVFLVILHSLVSPAPQHTHTHTHTTFRLLRSHYYRINGNAFTLSDLCSRPIHLSQREWRNETSFKVWIFISLVLASLLVTGTGLGEQPSGSLTGGHPYAAVMFSAN